ncbi:hypothetical protein E8L99_03815 [Phreatobacter aquaticus]|uniref:Uncharacterized protein n=1 Tax=Phreatobacter aquaticus TaxID=2570229 RepID=A0A4D7QE20_9HYPH|nr:hypothetical protein [Phreatobacter aquaticus]QCK84965.1 hypothetical protein E8L99_03815 [Phreatobacter aquaticus]
MAWYRCEAQGEPADGHFAVTRFVEAEAPEAAALTVRKSVGRELVRRGADPLSAEAYVSVKAVLRIDEEEVPGIAPDMIWSARAA